MKGGSLKQVRPFTETRGSTERTNPDYVEDTVSRMVRQILRLPFDQQKTFFSGLPLADRKAVAAHLRGRPDAARISDLVDEADRCLSLANSPHGCVSVAGKALDLTLACSNLPLKGTLGAKLRQLREMRKADAKEIRAHRVEELATELLKLLPSLPIRNAGAHFVVSKPEVSIAEAEAFLSAVRSLMEVEGERTCNLADLLSRA
jgi:hypothetical protein